MTRNTRSYIIAVTAFISMLIVNALANTVPLNGLSTGQVAALYPNFFTPAGITFSIWSVIYGFLIVFILLAWPRRNDLIVAKILPYLTLSCILNLSWIIVWHYLLPGLSVAIMLGLLVVLAVVFKTVQADKSPDLKMKRWLSISMTTYFAWICVATIANIAAFFVSLNWRGGIIPEPVWTVIMMSAATLLALKITSRYIVPSFSVVVIWAVFGIYFRWRESDSIQIKYGSLLLILLMLVHLIYIIRNRPVYSGDR